MKNMHHKAEKKSVENGESFIAQPLRGVEVNVCVKSFVKTCYRRTIQLYCCPSSNRTAFSGQKFTC
ncbi:TPA: hypothetical protein I4G87_25305 [Enterobacter hormaechei subsp. xiangfangensis]|nr:hypothetical protein [Enterobacter hormaechei subsp. xiangfangensis]HAS1884076.1 hypothetical protein [Enterobacter hormaechei subsp. xiangfangensis]